MTPISRVDIKLDGILEFRNSIGVQETQSFSLLIIRVAKNNGCLFFDLADGESENLWKSIELSSKKATGRMVKRSINFIAAKMKHADGLRGNPNLP